MLIKYEFLKILRKKSTRIVMAVSLILTAFLFGLPILQYQIYNQDGVLKGLEGIAYDKEQHLNLSVPLSEEYITEAIRKVQQLFENQDNVGYDGTEQFLIGDAYWNDIAPREDLLNMIAKTYADPNETTGYNKLPDLDVSDGANFYRAMESKIETLLNAPSRKLSDEQKEYWRSMAGRVETPLKYGYFKSWEIIMSSFELLMFAILAICIVVAPVFSGEYQAGTDAVILSGKYGKTKLITAKIIASFLFGVLAFTLHIVVACGLPLAAFGVDGWELPMQIANTVIPYPFTFLQAVLVNIGIIYLILFAMISLTLLLSSKMNTPYLVLIILVPVLFFPMFLTPNGTTGAYNLTLFLLPYRATMPEIGKYISYQFGSLVLDAFSVKGILYTALIVIMLPFARLGFKKHQVE
ncbi:MAG: ABC transporter permease subunit [Lachnospiraceae bacterium]|nr:ABC transporter permease subunit [Lachnospiraceae bacterium]